MQSAGGKLFLAYMNNRERSRLIKAAPLKRFTDHTITGALLKLSLLSVPASILAALFTRRFPPPVSDLSMRRFAFGLLCILGLSLILNKAQ